MPKYFALIHPQTPSDPIQTLPDTIQTPQDIGIFIQYRALEEKAISEYHDLIYFFANRFGIDASPDTIRHHPDIIQTPSDTIQTLPNIDVFMQQRVLEERAISEYGLFQILPIDLVLLHPEISSVLRHIPDTKQTPPDTTQTPPVIGVFARKATGRKGNI